MPSKIVRTKHTALGFEQDEIDAKNYTNCLDKDFRTGRLRSASTEGGTLSSLSELRM
jgi:hypothetical protein